MQYNQRNSRTAEDKQMYACIGIILALLTVMTVITIIIICLPAPSIGVSGLPSVGDTTPPPVSGGSEPDNPTVSHPSVGNFSNASSMTGCQIYSSDSASKLGNISSENAILVDMSTNIALYANDANERVQIASMTKVMTLIVSLDLIKSNDQMYERVEIKQVYGSHDLTGYQKAFRAGEKAYVIDLLYSVILQSGCDSALALAEHLAGSEEAFVAKMNEKAAWMGLSNTHFSNCYGGDDEGRNYSSVRDVGEIFMYALKNELARKILTTKSNTYMYYGYRDYSIAMFCQSMVMDGISKRDTGKANVLGGKSGNDKMAGYCLVSFGLGSDGREYLVVTAGDRVHKNSYDDTAYIYKNYVN